MRSVTLLTSFIAGLLVLSASTYADTLLAGYEPSETNIALSSPDNMTITKVASGIGGAPVATEGTHVLRLDWSGDDNLKVEIKHEWTDCFTFDFAGYDEVKVDVYLATSSAEPNIVGMWDDVFGWIEGDPLPKSLNTWNTISYNISARTEVGLDHIYALVFEQLHGDSGTIYIDNLRIVPRRTISFSGYDWTVLQSNWEIGSGPCHYTADQNDIWVDQDGYLHLSIVYKDPNWYCSEVIADASPGYGTYVYTVQGRVDLLDPNVIMGLFIYNVPDANENPREIDVELSRWGNPQNDNAQYVVQPHEKNGNLYRFNVDYSGGTDITTYVLIWTEDGIYFFSYYGDFSLVPSAGKMISAWHCSSPDIPTAGCENPRINFYLMDGEPPTNGQNVEIVIKKFQYLPDIDPIINLVDYSQFSSNWLQQNCGVCGGADIDGNENVDANDLFHLSAEWLQTVYQNIDIDDLVYIPSGTFQMGDSFSEGQPRELPVHTVTLDSFHMGKYKITNEQYCDYLNYSYPDQLKVIGGVVYAFLDSNYSFPYCNTYSADTNSQIDFNGSVFTVRIKNGRDMSCDPIAVVSWYGAVAYCNWRSSIEGRDICYNLSTWQCDFLKHGYRLPTEAEWEYAARSGLPGKRFPWGDTISHSQANYYAFPDIYTYDVSPTIGSHPDWNDGMAPYTSPVGSFSANEFGLYDMAGNVYDWCNDWFSDTYYSSSPQNNPTGPLDGIDRVRRGGCWNNNAGGCTVASRGIEYPSNPYNNNDLGFRLVLKN